MPKPIPFSAAERRKLAPASLAHNDVSTILGGLTEGFMATILESSPNCLTIVELDGSMSFINRNGQLALDIDDFAVLAGKEWADFWPVQARETIRKSIEKALKGNTTSLREFCPTALGDARWWDVTVAPVFGKDQSVERVLAISRDVTTEVIALNKIATTQIELFDENEAQAEKIKAQKRQLNSIDYSVKNSLSIVANSLTRQALDESDPQTASKLKQAALRIYPIRKVHDVECHIDHNTVNLKDYLTPLLTEAHALLEEDMLTLLMEIAPVETSTDNAIALGLIVSELISHIIPQDYGKQGGLLCFELSPSDTKTGRLIIRDVGVENSINFNPYSLSEIGQDVVSLYSQKLGASLTCGNDDVGGGFITIEF